MGTRMDWALTHAAGWPAQLPGGERAGVGGERYRAAAGRQGQRHGPAGGQRRRGLPGRSGAGDRSRRASRPGRRPVRRWRPRTRKPPRYRPAAPGTAPSAARRRRSTRPAGAPTARCPRPAAPRRRGWSGSAAGPGSAARSARPGGAGQTRCHAPAGVAEHGGLASPRVQVPATSGFRPACRRRRSSSVSPQPGGGSRPGPVRWSAVVQGALAPAVTVTPPSWPSASSCPSGAAASASGTSASPDCGGLVVQLRPRSEVLVMGEKPRSRLGRTPATSVCPARAGRRRGQRPARSRRWWRCPAGSAVTSGAARGQHEQLPERVRARRRAHRDRRPGGPGGVGRHVQRQRRRNRRTRRGLPRGGLLRCRTRPPARASASTASREPRRPRASWPHRPPRVHRGVQGLGGRVGQLGGEGRLGGRRSRAGIHVQFLAYLAVGVDDEGDVAVPDHRAGRQRLARAGRRHCRPAVRPGRAAGQVPPVRGRGQVLLRGRTPAV